MWDALPLEQLEEWRVWLEQSLPLHIQGPHWMWRQIFQGRQINVMSHGSIRAQRA